MNTLCWLDPDTLEFPDPSLALSDPDGLIAVGGDLSPERILAAYRKGIFPWFNPGDPILWWSPDPRTVVFPNQLHISKSLRKTLRKATYRVTFDNCFEKVMRACAAPRSYADGTWISEDIIEGYCALHQRGIAHSVEVWRNDELVGGLYGIALGRVFFGESMFSRADNASKVGFAHLVRQLCTWNFQLIDCQVANDHLFSLGAVEIPREEFRQLLVNFAHEPDVYSLPWSTLTLAPWE
ncbi:leucyl/phenylalanyl-tRNA--protein transferase [Cellvibrio sp. pealriver]|uniref:leucyl/phenylalanyl-tRNA--protein transferase n=1 Tax=Cellvibrio sp. pealriver TaxID=1622269 RepID=UPI00066FCDC3|nr:leucyl/phenylalanyl-tRNA--protein transferase [Cellvibrio sp. pealriver]